MVNLIRKLSSVILFLFLLIGIGFNSTAVATCHQKLNKPGTNCYSYNSHCFINKNDTDIAFVNRRSNQLFRNECLSHQLCSSESAGTKTACDDKFINDIEYQCKVNFGRLMVEKKIPKRTRTCLKRVKKSCSGLIRNCGQICVLYGSDKIMDQRITQYIKYPRKSDYSLPGAVFYPSARYKACLSVTQGYKSALSYRRKQNNKTTIQSNHLMMTQDSKPAQLNNPE